MMKAEGFDFPRLWRVLAYALIAAALMLLYLGRTDLAFFAAALGLSAWFLNVRAAVKRKHDLVKDGARNWRPRSEVEERYAEDEEEE
jgi:heme O synthase-like polyprenyltransferase